MFAMQIAAAIEDARPQALAHLRAPLWKAHAAGLIDDDTAQALAEKIETRRHAAEEARPGASSRPAGGSSLFPPRRAQHARLHPERISRRRRLAASGPMPPQIAASFTTGEAAVLRIVSDEVREYGACDRSLAEIAARAGVCRSLAQVTLRRAASLGLVSIEERRQRGAKNLPNVVRIVSPEWLTWLDHGRPATSSKGGSKKLAPTDTKTIPWTKNRTSIRHSKSFGEREQAFSGTRPRPIDHE